MRNINRGFRECHRGNIARAIRKDHVHFDANDQLRSDRVGEQWVITIDPGVAVDTQSLRGTMHRNEQHPDMRVDGEVADTLEHAVAVVVRKCKFRRSGDPDKSGRATLEGAIRMSGRVGGRYEEIDAAFNKDLVVVSERGTRPLLEAIGKAPTAKLILKYAIALV